MEYTMERVLVKELDDPADFLEAAGPVLLADEARHNLILGIAGTLRDLPPRYPTFQLWVVTDERVPVAAALRTPPFNLVLAGQVEGVTPLADALAHDDAELPGATGAVPEVEAFAARFEAGTGVRARERMRQRIYRLEQLRPVSNVSGTGRIATEADRDLLVQWVRAFAEELYEPGAPAGDAERTVELRLESRGESGFVIWEDGERVSLAGWGSPTPNGIRIGPVYTPPEYRRRGYGSAATAAATARNLAAGRRFCFLYTDVANPTSNKIYMDIGYEPVCDSVEFAFDPV